MKTKLLFILLCSCGLAVADALAEVPSESLLAKQISQAHEKTFDLYLNGHFVWVKTEQAAEGEKKRRYEYWARDGIYFRLDSQDITDSDAVNIVSRTIVIPEGFAKIAADGIDDVGAIFDFGPAEAGRNWVLSHQFIAMANRVATVQVADWVEAWESKSQDLESLTLRAIEPSGARLEFVCRPENATQHHAAEMSGRQYRVDRWTYRYETDDRSQWATNEIDLTYENELVAIPKLMSEKDISNFAKPLSYSYLLEHYDNKSPPIDIFTIPGSETGIPSSTSAWARRLSVLCIGVLMLGFYLYYRKSGK